MDEEFELFEDKEAYRLARQLSELIKESEEYRYYRKCLEEIKEQPDLYARVNELRRMNFELQNGSSDRMSYEQYADVSYRVTDLRKNPIVSKFLNSEVALGRLVQTVFRQIMEGIDFDIEFLSQE